MKLSMKLRTRLFLSISALITVALPFSLAGIWLGQRLYLRLDEAQLRRLVWALLAVLGAIGLAQALLRTPTP